MVKFWAYCGHNQTQNGEYVRGMFYLDDILGYKHRRSCLNEK